MQLLNKTRSSYIEAATAALSSFFPAKNGPPHGHHEDYTLLSRSRIDVRSQRLSIDSQDNKYLCCSQQTSLFSTNKQTL